MIFFFVLSVTVLILALVLYMVLSYNNIHHYVPKNREVGYTTYNVKSGDTISKIIDDLQKSDEGLSLVPDRVIFDIIMSLRYFL